MKTPTKHLEMAKDLDYARHSALLAGKQKEAAFEWIRLLLADHTSQPIRLEAMRFLARETHTTIDAVVMDIQRAWTAWLSQNNLPVAPKVDNGLGINVMNIIIVIAGIFSLLIAVLGMWGILYAIQWLIQSLFA